MDDVEELYRRLAQARRMHAQPVDPLTKTRLAELVAELEQQLAAAEAGNTDAPPE
ncbi:MAG: hypothetical protein Q7T73_02230 [Beijerinckiaceae bacterium]|nr:hypothetical protein [Beijerinckiaceae bacterium]